MKLKDGHKFTIWFFVMFIVLALAMKGLLSLLPTFQFKHPIGKYVYIEPSYMNRGIVHSDRECSFIQHGIGKMEKKFVTSLHLSCPYCVKEEEFDELTK